jgi:hypothetical protein
MNAEPISLSGDVNYEGYLLSQINEVGIWLVLDGKRWLFPDEETYVGLVGAAQPVAVIDIYKIPIAEAFTHKTSRVLQEGSDAQFLVGNKMKRLITSLEAVKKYHFDTGTLGSLQQYVLDLIPSGPNITA